MEGWEKFVLMGGENFFKEYAPFVMIEFTESNTFNVGYHVQELYDILRDYGYEWYTFVEGELKPETKKLHYPYNNLIAKKG